MVTRLGHLGTANIEIVQQQAVNKLLMTCIPHLAKGQNSRLEEG